MFFSCLCTSFKNCYKRSISNRTQDEIIRYDKKKTLDRFCNILDEVARHYEFDALPIKFSSKNEKPQGFFVYDLIDTTNNSTAGVLNFKEGHVYHFASGYLYYSVSNICILRQGKLIFFKALNCKKKIDDVKDVVKYLKLYLPERMESEEIIDRILHYRRYGRYLKVDYRVCKCEN